MYASRKRPKKKCSQQITYSVFAATFRTVPVWWDTHRSALQRTFRFFSLCPGPLCPAPVDLKFSTEFCWFPILFYPFYWCPMFFSRLRENRSRVSNCITNIKKNCIVVVVFSRIKEKNGRRTLIILVNFHEFHNISDAILCIQWLLTLILCCFQWKYVSPKYCAIRTKHTLMFFFSWLLKCSFVNGDRR